MDITQKIESLGVGKYLGTFEPQSPDWHKARAGIGGSDVGALLNKSPWKSQFQLWAELTGQVSAEVKPSMPMILGTAFEPVIRQLFSEMNSDFLTVHETGTWQSIETPTHKANPDGIIEYINGGLSILEIKFTRQYWDDLPEHYNLQVQHYMSVLGLNTAVVVAVTGGDWKEFTVSRDDSLIEEIKTRSGAFYDLVKTKQPPEYDGSQATYETVRKISTGLVDGEIELGSMWSHLLRAKLESEIADNSFMAQKSAMLAFMDGIKYGTYQGDKVITLQARNGKPFITFK